MDLDFQLRACVPGDEQALSLLGQASFLESFAGILHGHDIVAHCERQHAAAIYRDWLADAAMRIWVAEVNPGQAPVGYLVLSPAKLPIPDPRPDDLEIKRIYLLHRFHGQRLGKRLLEQAVAHAREQGSRRIVLGVYADNHDALAFYARCGFRPLSSRTFRVGDTDYNDTILALEL